jgi:hypothetical protein
LIFFLNRESIQYIDNKRSSIVEIGDEDDDTFERFLSVTSHQDTLISSYYLNNADSQMQITEVFEINESVPVSIVPCDIEAEPSVEIEEIYDFEPQSHQQSSLSPVPVITEI